MRSSTNNGITLRYPDAIGFAFNPCIIIAEGTGVTQMSMVIKSTDDEQDVVMKAFGAKCYGDVREYVQTMFDTMAFGDVSYTAAKKSDMCKNVSFAVTVTKVVDGTTSTGTFSFYTTYVWGALRVGGYESYNGYRKLTWFRGYPFTFGLYTTGGGSLTMMKDGVADRVVNISEQGVWNIPVLSSDSGKVYVVMDSTGTFSEATFDYTFDITFRQTSGTSESEKMRIDVVDDWDEGYYLRWVDRHGFYCYYLFKTGEEARKTSNEDVYIRNNLLLYDETYGYDAFTGKRQNMGREDTIPVCAPLVDSDTFDMLTDIATSPCVDLYEGTDADGVPKWITVTVVAGTFTKTKEVLQDFICQIVMPAVPLQKL